MMYDLVQFDGQLLEWLHDVFSVIAFVFVAGVALVLLAQVAVMASCCCETQRGLRRRNRRKTSSAADGH